MMKISFVLVRAIACVLLLLHVGLVNADEPSKEMRAALGELIVAKNTEAAFSEMLASLPTEGVAMARRMAEQKMSELGLPESEHENLMKAIDEVVPQMYARLNAEVAQMDMRALLTDMLESSYAKHFSVTEIHELAAIYAHPAYDKAMELATQVAQQHERTGQDTQLLRAQLGAALSVEEKRFAATLDASAVLRKERELQSRLEAETGASFARRFRPMLVDALDRNYAIIHDKVAASRAK